MADGKDRPRGDRPVDLASKRVVTREFLALVALTLIRGGTLRIRRAYWWGTAAFGTLIVPAVGSSPTINVISANSAVPQPPDE